MRGKLKELAVLFLKLGSIAFGGPAAHIAMMEDEVVKRRGWLTHEHFLDLLGTTNLIPGPNSTEMAIHIGYVRCGWKGVAVAGVCFILPAVAITLLLAHLYVVFGTVPQASGFIWGIRAAVIAVILAAVFRLSKTIVRNWFKIIAFLIVALLSLLHVDEIALLLGAGLVGLAWQNRHRLRGTTGSVLSFALLPALAFVPISGAVGDHPVTLSGLGLFFLKIGSILYGSGYVLVAFLQGGLVDAQRWLSQTQLLDAIAIGQLTPGPVLSTATFIGYLILGLPGALVSTAGIFLPSFIFVGIIGPFVPKLRKSQHAVGFLDGVTSASLGLMMAVCVTLGMTTLTNVSSWIIFGIAAIILFRWNPNPAWIVVGSAVIGWLLSSLV